MPTQQSICNDAGKRVAQTKYGVKRDRRGTPKAGNDTGQQRAAPRRTDEDFASLPKCAACLGFVADKCRFKGQSVSLILILIII